jgi:hypothetical protein
MVVVSLDEKQKLKTGYWSSNAMAGSSFSQKKMDPCFRRWPGGEEMKEPVALV